MKTLRKFLLMALVVLGLGLLISGCAPLSNFIPFIATSTPPASPTFTPVPPTVTLTPTITPSPSPTPIPAVRITSGDHALFLGDYNTALSEYRSAWQSASQDASADPEILAAALLGQGRVAYITGEYATALDHLRRLVEQYPSSPHRPAGFFFLGQTYDALARYTDAANAYQAYLSLNAGVIDTYVYELRGDSLSAAGDFAGALGDYRTALQSERAGNVTNLQIKAARTYALTGDYNTAIVMYNDIYARSGSDTTRSRVNLLMGQSYMASGQTEQAYAAWLDSVENYPTAYDSYLALINLVEAGYPVSELDRGLVDYFASQPVVALAAFDRYLSAEPFDPVTAYYYKGLTLIDMQDYAGAIQQFDLIIQYYPGYSLWDDAWEMKADVFWYYLDDPAGAMQTLLTFVETGPQELRAPEFLYYAARIAERSGELQIAAQVWERIPNEYPSSAEAFDALFLGGITRYRLGDYAGAQANFERLLGFARNLSQQSQALFWTGKALQAAGDAEGARRLWEQTANTDPTGYYSERARDILRGYAPFNPPAFFDLAYDPALEKREAEEWLHATFAIPNDVDLGGLGPLASDGRLVRGTELWNLGLGLQARTEFEALRETYSEDPISSYRLANYFGQIGLYRSSILAARQVLNLAGLDDAATLNAPAHFSHIRFGPYFSEIVVPVAQSYGLHPLLLFSIIRQESLFESIAHSSAAARGLMQIIPSTGQGIYAQNGWPPNYTSDDLYRPLVSITFGADYLYDQLQYLDGDIYAALAAYNGGPGNSRIWKGLAGNDPDLFLEVVRFEETRRYIRNIYEIFSIYRRIYNRAP